jgi:demethylmenaquinone methyltransferase/2-methoxy-6-polyprenyl-1,4-benzoquinol methylase
MIEQWNGPSADGSAAMFEAIAGRYDLLNRILSLGQDQRWRREAVLALELEPGDVVLDVGTGTADVALAVLQACPDTRVVGLDPARAMLRLGAGKATCAGRARRIRFLAGDGQRLPLRDDSVAGAIVAFGIRNFPDRLGGLREMGRVVRPGGRVVVLELTMPREGALAVPARLWVRGAVPLIGAALSARGAYRYLRDSVRTFPSREEFNAVIEEAGLRILEARPLSFGAAHLFVGEVLPG